VKGTLEDAAEKLLGKTVCAVKTEVAKDSESMESTSTSGGMEKKLEPITEKTSAVKLHKDFKISGQIDCKAGISYTSFIRQIEIGKQKGYSEVDIIDVVIKAVVPSSSLCSYLDGRPDINLATLRSILRIHYAEKTQHNSIVNLQVSRKMRKKALMISYCVSWISETVSCLPPRRIVRN
jgi:hypothetical protein